MTTVTMHITMNEDSVWPLLLHCCRGNGSCVGQGWLRLDGFRWKPETLAREIDACNGQNVYPPKSYIARTASNLTLECSSYLSLQVKPISSIVTDTSGHGFKAV